MARKKKTKEDKEDIEPWRKSDAKRLLAQDIINGDIDGDMEWEDVFSWRPEFASTSRRLFKSRFASLLTQISSARVRSITDKAALEHDRKLFPIKTHNHRGEPRWDGSAAQSWLRVDVENGEHKRVAPRILHESREAYKVYPLKVFREHVHQEVRFQKFCTWRNETKKAKATEWM